MGTSRLEPPPIPSLGCDDNVGLGASMRAALARASRSRSVPEFDESEAAGGGWPRQAKLVHVPLGESRGRARLAEGTLRNRRPALRGPPVESAGGVAASVPVRQRRGRAAERLALAHLRHSGMVVLACNVYVGHLEIDILARDGDAVVVVEVRGRGENAWQRPLASVGHLKVERVRRAAGILWARRWRYWPGIERVRFDVISVDLRGGQVEHIRAAF